MVTAFFSKCVCVWGGGYSKRISIAKNNRQIFYKISWGWGAGLVGGWRVLPLIKIYKSEPLISFFQVHTQKKCSSRPKHMHAISNKKTEMSRKISL